MKKYVFLLCTLLILSVNAQVQKEFAVSGTITDESSGESLIGATVLLQELKTGASTNINGNFVISQIPPGTYNFIVSYIGYTTVTKQMRVDDDCLNCLNIALVPASVSTEEIVISADSVKLSDRIFAAPISKIEMSSKTVNSVPRVIEADLLRALQTMPGIVALSDFSSALYVRGGTPDQNLYLVDGTDVYNPEHAFGIFSTFNTDAIKKADVSKGGFGSEFGGRLSSVLNVTNLDGNRNHFEGVANISLLSASTTLQMPLGSIGSISGSIRRTYLDQTYAKWVKEIPDYYFYDGNVKAFLDLGKSDKLTISFFKGYDDLNFSADKDKPQSFKFLYDWGNSTGSVNWRHILSPQLFLNTWITLSDFSSNFSFDQAHLEEKNILQDYTAKTSIEYYATNELAIKAGLEHKIIHSDFDFKNNTNIIKIERWRRLSSGYLSSNWKPTPLWDIELGVRASVFDSETDYASVEPRFSAKYRLDELSSVKLAGGTYSQYVHRVPRLFFSSIWATSDQNIKASRAAHLILGYQRALFNNSIELQVEGYYKKYFDIYQYNQKVGTVIIPSYYENGMPVYTETNGIFTRGNGDSYGVEVFLRKEVGPFNGWLGYTYAITNHTFDGINQGESYHPRHDRSHVVNATGNIDLGYLFSGDISETKPGNSRWLFGFNFIYTSGQPITAPGSAYNHSLMPDWKTQTGLGGNSDPKFLLYPGDINGYNLPAYMRFDFNINYEIYYEGWTLTPYLQVINAGSRKNVWFVSYSYDQNYDTQTGQTTIVQKPEKQNMLPLLPSIGVTIKF